MKPEPSEETCRGRLPSPRCCRSKNSLKKSSNGEPGGNCGIPSGRPRFWMLWVVEMFTTAGSSRSARSAKSPSGGLACAAAPSSTTNSMPAVAAQARIRRRCRIAFMVPTSRLPTGQPQQLPLLARVPWRGSARHILEIPEEFGIRRQDHGRVALLQRLGVGLQRPVEGIEFRVPVGSIGENPGPFGIALTAQDLRSAAGLGQQHGALAVGLGTDLLGQLGAGRALLVGLALTLGLHT